MDTKRKSGKRILPKLKIGKPRVVGYYGSTIGNNIRKSWGFKVTLVCPRCGYSSRVNNASKCHAEKGVVVARPWHNASLSCPKHGDCLVGVGMVQRLPKKASGRIQVAVAWRGRK